MSNNFHTKNQQKLGQPLNPICLSIHISLFSFSLFLFFSFLFSLLSFSSLFFFLPLTITETKMNRKRDDNMTRITTKACGVKFISFNKSDIASRNLLFTNQTNWPVLKIWRIMRERRREKDNKNKQTSDMVFLRERKKRKRNELKQQCHNETKKKQHKKKQHTKNQKSTFLNYFKNNLSRLNKLSILGNKTKLTGNFLPY